MWFPSWVWFLISLSLILYLAATNKVDLWIGIFGGAFIFAFFSDIDFLFSLRTTFFNLSNLFLCLAVALIPILGGIMKESGMMLELVQKLNISKKSKFMFYPALLGLLPIPGGALFSAPLVDEIDENLDKSKKVAINVWFRHVLILIYPLSATLVVASQLTNHNLWSIVGILTIPLAILIIIGYFTLIRGNFEEDKKTGNLKIFFRNLTPIIISPIISGVGVALLPSTINDSSKEIFQNLFFFIGIVLGILIALFLTKSLNTTEMITNSEKRRDLEHSEDFLHIPNSNYKEKLAEIPRIAKEIKFWRFPLLIYAMLYFKDVFILSDTPEFIGNLNMNMGLYILIAFFLGFATGRVQLPISILFPIYMAQFGLITLPYFDFLILYTAIFMGYVCTPVHPCISLSIEFFEIDYKKGVKYLLYPTLIIMVLLYIIYLISLSI